MSRTILYSESAIRLDEFIGVTDFEGKADRCARSKMRVQAAWR